MAENPFLWSITASDNDDADAAVPWPEGMLPGAVNNGARAIMAGIARYIADTNGTLATTGSSNAYLVTSNSAHTTYTNGTLIAVRANFTNTAACTLNMNSFGGKAIRIFGLAGETDPSAGQIQQNATYKFRYDSAANSAAGAWILLNPSIAPKVGSIEPWPGTSQPSGYFFCNGASISRTTYAALFAVIGTTYGSSSGSTFNLPDLNCRTIVGSDAMGVASGRVTSAGSGIDGTTVGASGGAETHALTAAQNGVHTHTGTTGTESATHIHIATTGTESAGHTHTGTTDNDSPDHTHNYDKGGITAAAGAAVNVLSSPTSAVATGGASARHTHTFTTGQESATHTHTVTVGTESATHTHSFTSDSSGSGTAHNNMPPALVMNWVIKF